MMRDGFPATDISARGLKGGSLCVVGFHSLKPLAAGHCLCTFRRDFIKREFAKVSWNLTTGTPITKGSTPDRTMHLHDVFISDHAVSSL